MIELNKPLLVILIALVVFFAVSFFILRKKENRSKFFILILIIVSLICIYIFRNFILDLFKGIPFIWHIIGPIVSEVEKGSLLGLFYLTFFGSLFFICIPAEFSILYYLSLGHNPAIVIFITILGNLSGLIIDYLFGRFFGENLMMFFLSNKFSGLKGIFEKVGGTILIIGNILPFGSEVVVLVAGSIKYNFKKFLIYSVIGMTVKYCGTFFLKHYLTVELFPKIKEFFSFM